MFTKIAKVIGTHPQYARSMILREQRRQEREESKVTLNDPAIARLTEKRRDESVRVSTIHNLRACAYTLCRIDFNESQIESQ